MDNFCILALFQVLIADNFGILAFFQVLIADIMVFWAYFQALIADKVYGKNYNTADPGLEPMTSYITSLHSTNCATNLL